MDYQNLTQYKDELDRYAEAKNAIELHLEGETDAAFGELPQCTDPNYLEGYLSIIKAKKTNSYGRIIWR